MNIVTWEFVGYNMIIIYSALRSIPTELYEAAEIDGAGQFRIAWSIKIPAIRPAIMLTVIFSIIGTFQLFNEPQLLSIDRPQRDHRRRTRPNLYAYTLAFVNHDVNYAATIAFALGIRHHDRLVRRPDRSAAPAAPRSAPNERHRTDQASPTAPCRVPRPRRGAREARRPGRMPTQQAPHRHPLGHRGLLPRSP